MFLALILTEGYIYLLGARCLLAEANLVIYLTTFNKEHPNASSVEYCYKNCLIKISHFKNWAQRWFPEKKIGERELLYICKISYPHTKSLHLISY